MPLFIVRHQHDSGSCPAQDPGRGANLLNHLSRPNVRRHGITIHGEAVARSEHTLYMIVEAADEGLVRQYMSPFGTAGTLDVYHASTCADVVSRGGCAFPALEPTEASSPAVDAGEACQQAIEDGLVVHRAHPLNGEISIPDLIRGAVMPNARFYVRNHFHIPNVDAAEWRLRVGGLVERPLNLSARHLANMPSEARVVTLECAGNGRSTLAPRVAGEQWNLGAVSTAEWTGVALKEVLRRAGPRANARHVVFRGADSGAVEGRDDTIVFERSLSIDEAMESDALLAYAMNGEPLPRQHGFPLRVIVPSWYAVASVKWLMEIELVEQPFLGHYQADAYYFERESNGQITREPVTLQRVRSIITEPAPDSEVERGDFVVRGVAWSGAAAIACVEVQLNDGPWQRARLLGDGRRHAWQWWELMCHAETAGQYTIRSRATDLAGRAQPERPEWNRLGYCNNAIQRIAVSVL